MANKPLPNEVVNIINLIDTHLKWKNQNGPPRSYEIYHPSAFGGCLRKMQYQRYEERGLIEATNKEKPKPSMIRIWDTGHTTQSRWEEYFTDLGILRGVWVCKNTVCRPGDKPRTYGRDNKIGVFKPDKCECGCEDFHYNEVTVKVPELNMRGHVDCILDFSRLDLNRFKEGNPVPIMFKPDELPKGPIVVDMKTINSFGFKKKLADGPPFEYKIQVTIYAHALGLDYGLLIYECKDNSEVKIDFIERNDEIWNEIQRQAKQMDEMVEEGKLPPPRPSSKTSRDCRYCDFKSICHGDGKGVSIWDNPNLNKLRKAFYGKLLED